MPSFVEYLHNKIQQFCERSPAYALTLLGRGLTEFTTIPSDPWPGDSRVAQSFLEGALLIDNHTYTLHDCLNALSFPDHAPVFLKAYMHNFGWLRDLRTISTNSSRKLARQLISHWIHNNHDWKKKSWLFSSWKADLIGTRLSHWIALYDFFGASADDNFRSLFFKSLNKQYRHLSRTYRTIENPLLFLRALKGLIFCAATLRSHKHRLPFLLIELEKTLEQQIYSDGGHSSRSPALQFLVLQDLIDLRSLLRQVSVENTSFLHQTINSMAPLVRLFRHGDGKLAEFKGNVDLSSLGIDSESISSNKVDIVLSMADVRGRPPSRAAEMGYERSMTKTGLLLLSTKPSTSSPNFSDWDNLTTNALEFEWSIGRQRIIRRGDVLIHREDHSPLRLSPDQQYSFKTKRSTQEGHSFLLAEIEAKDGFYYKHQRQFYLSSQEGDFRGQDTLFTSDPAVGILRFILPPNIEVIDTTLKGVKIRIQPLHLPSSHKDSLKIKDQIWRFRSTGQEEIICGPHKDLPHPAILLVTDITSQKAKIIKWAFQLESS